MTKGVKLGGVGVHPKQFLEEHWGSLKPLFRFCILWLLPFWGFSKNSFFFVYLALFKKDLDQGPREDATLSLIASSGVFGEASSSVQMPMLF